MPDYDTELLDRLDKIEKKLDRLLNLNTRIAKALHLLPVTEKEEKAIQIAQRTNLQLSAKVNDDLNAIEGKVETDDSVFGMSDVANVYSDILGDDFNIIK